MQVSCPSCRARYAVDPLAIGPSGRTVQCARCNERWFQTVKVEPKPEPPPAPAEAEKPAAPADASTAEGKRSWFSAFAPKAKPKPKPEKIDPVAPTEAAAEPKEPEVIPPEADAEPAPAESETPFPSRFAMRTTPRVVAAAAAVGARRDDSEMPVPDLVIRPPSRGAMLPALIEPKADRRMGYVLAGAIALLLLAAVGVLLFHDAITQLLPAEWRALLSIG